MPSRKRRNINPAVLVLGIAIEGKMSGLGAVLRRLGRETLKVHSCKGMPEGPTDEEGSSVRRGRSNRKQSCELSGSRSHSPLGIFSPIDSDIKDGHRQRLPTLKMLPSPSATDV